MLLQSPGHIVVIEGKTKWAQNFDFGHGKIEKWTQGEWS
jgi:hypothetical protein